MNGIKGQLTEMLTRLKSKGLIKAVPDAEPQYKCQRCKDTGYITEFVDGVPYAHPCACLVQHQVAARLRRSGISAADYARYRFDNFRTDTSESTAMMRMAKQYLACRRKGEGFAVVGKSGTGKTHICIAICHALTEQYGEEHYYFSYRSEIQKIKAAMYKSGEYERIMEHWRTVPNLYIDDLFKEARIQLQKVYELQSQDRQIMYDLINARLMSKRATLFSSELTMGELLMTDEAIGSRICQMTRNYIYKTTGDNRRLAV